jgi:hypothetical protein
MSKDLANITEEEIKTICSFYNEPYISFMAGKWPSIGLAIKINTTSTLNNQPDDSYITIYYDVKVQLSRNNGNWGGHRYEDINPLITIDYLRLKGYEFKYDKPEIFKKLERKQKIDEING